MENEWREVPLGDLFKVKHGFAFKGEYFTDVPSQNLLVTPGNFSTSGEFKNTKPKYYNGPIPEGYRLAPGQVVVSMTDLSKASDTLGFAVRIPDDENKWLHNQRVGLLDFSGFSVDPVFVSYLLRTREYRSWVVGSATGTTVKHTSPKRILKYRCKVPHIGTQRRIGEFLFAFDKKIELNRKLNETLESAAQALFKGWFIDFDPVIDNTINVGREIPESVVPRAEARQALGDARIAHAKAIHADFPSDFDFREEVGFFPRGWKVATVAQSILVNPRASLSKGAVATYVDMKALPTSGYSITNCEKKPYTGGAKFMNGDVLLARITPCLENGKTGYVDFLDDGEVGFGSTEFVVLRAQGEVGSAYIACLARHPDFRAHCVQSMVGSSGRQRVQNACFSSYFLALPGQALLDRFADFADPILERTRAASSEARALSALRDVLLPKLLSGEITVTDAEKLAADAL